jgi:hypothetical protein
MILTKEHARIGRRRCVREERFKHDREEFRQAIEHQPALGELLRRMNTNAFF